MATRTRGRRLPQRVYWVRRGVVLLVAAALVLGIAQLIGGLGSDPGQAASQDKAATVAGKPSASTSQAPVVGPVAPAQSATRKKSAAPAPAIAPQGECSDDEINVLPQVTKAAAGGTINLTLQLTGTQPACTYEVSPTSLAVKITSGNDRIWSSQDCPKSIPTQSVVVRSGTPTAVDVAWSGRRSDQDCSTHTGWALPGFYHLFAAVMGSAATDVQFEVTLPDRPVVTRTAKPKPQPTPTPATPAPSGTTKGKQSKCGGDNAAGTC
jgi:hypothetical protein